MLIGPEVVPGMTKAVIEVVDEDTSTAFFPPTVTDCAVEKSVPLTLTNAPTGPLSGVSVSPSVRTGPPIPVVNPHPARSSASTNTVSRGQYRFIDFSGSDLEGTTAG